MSPHISSRPFFTIFDIFHIFLRVLILYPILGGVPFRAYLERSWANLPKISAFEVKISAYEVKICACEVKIRVYEVNIRECLKVYLAVTSTTIFEVKSCAWIFEQSSFSRFLR